MKPLVTTICFAALFLTACTERPKTAGEKVGDAIEKAKNKHP